MDYKMTDALLVGWATTLAFYQSAQYSEGNPRMALMNALVIAPFYVLIALALATIIGA